MGSGDAPPGSAAPILNAGRAIPVRGVRHGACRIFTLRRASRAACPAGAYGELIQRDYELEAGSSGKIIAVPSEVSSPDNSTQPLIASARSLLAVAHSSLAAVRSSLTAARSLLAVAHSSLTAARSLLAVAHSSLTAARSSLTAACLPPPGRSSCRTRDLPL